MISEHDLAIANRLKDLVLQADGKRVSRVILFGSRARGDARPDSDFDLLILVRDITPAEKRLYRLACYRVLRGAGVAAEPWVMGEEEFEETKNVIGGLAYPAWKEGVILHESVVPGIAQRLVDTEALTPYAVETRSPADEPPIDREDTSRHLMMARKVLGTVTALLKSYLDAGRPGG